MTDRISPEASDAFFNSEAAQDAFASTTVHAIKTGKPMDTLFALQFVAGVMIARGDLTDEYTPHQFAVDFMERV